VGRVMRAERGDAIGGRRSRRRRAAHSSVLRVARLGRLRAAGFRARNHPLNERCSSLRSPSDGVGAGRAGEERALDLHLQAARNERPKLGGPRSLARWAGPASELRTMAAAAAAAATRLARFCQFGCSAGGAAHTGRREEGSRPLTSRFAASGSFYKATEAAAAAIAASRLCPCFRCARPARPATVAEAASAATGAAAASLRPLAIVRARPARIGSLKWPLCAPAGPAAAAAAIAEAAAEAEAAPARR